MFISIFLLYFNYSDAFLLQRNKIVLPRTASRQCSRLLLGRWLECIFGDTVRRCTHFGASVYSVLDFSLWSFINPATNGFDRCYVVNHSLQIRMVCDQIRLGHVVQIVQNGGEINVGPTQLKNEERKK